MIDGFICAVIKQHLLCWSSTTVHNRTIYQLEKEEQNGFVLIDVISFNLCIFEENKIEV